MRTTQTFLTDWLFCFDAKTEDTADFAPVTLPHTWNNLDGQDGGNDYKRGVGLYKKTFAVKKQADKCYYLDFLGVNAVCEVILNGQSVATHRGGYTRFCVPVTDALSDGENTLLVRADNSPFPDVNPLEADFTFFGGIYREVYFIETEAAHFLPENGADGVKITVPNTPAVRNDAPVTVQVKTSENAVGKTLSVSVRVPSEFRGCPYIQNTDFPIDAVLSKNGETVAKQSVTLENTQTELCVHIQNPHLWNGRKDPFCYTVVCELRDGDTVLDRVEKQIGIRYFEIHPQKGFFLNGNSYPLRGVNRHQDRENMGNAITRKEHDEDFSILYEIGANGVRLAHYPHHPHFYDLCDRYGLLVWAEIPFVDHIGGLKESPLSTDTVLDKAVTARQLENAVQQMTELILQQGHRPSVFCWSMSNEVMQKYGDTAAEMMRTLHETAHRLDDTRYTAMAVNHTYGYRWQSDVKGCNIYPGWYMGKPSHFRYQVNYHIRGNGGKGIAVSEYGAGANTLHHSEIPKQPKDTTCAFHPEEWASIVHEHALRYFMSPRHNKVWGAFVWNLFDFAVDIRNEGELPGRNDKGLVTYDRKTKKDAFFLYKAYWSRDPVTYITSRRFTVRERQNITVKVYSNADAVTLTVNGKSVKTKKAKYNRQKNVFLFQNIRLQNGENTVTANGTNGESDTVIWQFSGEK
ncbi:MAG: glycoside hydrolase family 2 TIM barrel-domain containing protein [Candidatus Fimenecus sp.]